MRIAKNEHRHPETELAFDEAMLLEADASDTLSNASTECMRVWEFTSPVVVLGRSSKFEGEVNHEFCHEHDVSVLRRCSGGASIVAGPGCLMYSVVLSFALRPELQKIDVAHRFVMQRLLGAVREQVPSVQMQGTCDLTFDDRKFSGNSLRISRQHLLYHGTILYDADLELISRCLATPPRQPEYRRQRIHRDFLTNLDVDPIRLVADVERVFCDAELPEPAPLDWTDKVQQRTQELVAMRYSDPLWHRRH
jgi:lipoate---protein ligase